MISLSFKAMILFNIPPKEMEALKEIFPYDHLRGAQQLFSDLSDLIQ